MDVDSCTIKKAEWWKNWCFWTVVLEKTLESPLDCKEIQPVDPKGNQSWYSLEGLMLNLKLQYFGHLSKELTNDAGKDWSQEKGMTEDELAGWHYWLSGHGFEQAPIVVDGQGNLVCCNLWGRKESDTTERLNWTVLPIPKYLFPSSGLESFRHNFIKYIFDPLLSLLLFLGPL